MKAKITRVEEGLAVVLHPSLVEQLGFEENTDVDVSADGDALIVTRVDDVQREEAFRDAAQKVVERHAGLFRRLSK